VTKVVGPVLAILEDRMRLGKEGMRNVSSLDVALYPVALAMDIWNVRATYSPLLFSARLNFLLASAALIRLLESKSSLLTGGSAFFPLRGAPA
jgi:hypothetical protein